jgi:hypothetical protein
MSDALQPFAELDRLLDCLAAGTLDEPGHARLDELVLSDLAARRHYIERMYLMAELHARLARTATPAEVPVPRVESAPLDRRRGPAVECCLPPTLPLSLGECWISSREA